MLLEHPVAEGDERAIRAGPLIAAMLTGNVFLDVMSVVVSSSTRVAFEEG